jgi:hypothetical protein
MLKSKRVFPWVTFALVAINVLVFTATVDSNLLLTDEVATGYGFVPSRFFDGSCTWCAVTHIFLHAEIMHLGSNMLALLFIGSSLESRVGHARYMALYILCGVLAAVAFGALNPASTRPAVGASAAIFGVMGTLSLLYPTSFVILIVIPVPIMLISAVYAIVTVAMIQAGDTGPVGHFAHLAGMGSGMMLAFLMEPVDALKGLVIFVISVVAIVIAMGFL